MTFSNIFFKQINDFYYEKKQRCIKKIRGRIYPPQ